VSAEDADAASVAVRRLGLGIDPDPLFADLIAAVAAASRDLGIEPVDVRTPSDLAVEPVDRLLLVGRPGRHRPFLSRPMSIPTTVWTGEPLPPAGSARRGAARAQLIRRVARPAGATLRSIRLPGGLDRRRVSLTTERLVRANLHELVMAASAGADVVVTSRDRAATLAGWGVTARTVPFGYHLCHAGALTPPGTGVRDVPLLLLGSRAEHTRRAAAVDRLRANGARHGLLVEDASWGADRDALLRRTRVMLDVHRVPGNFVGLRLLLSLAAGVALVSEPMTDPWPFVPGVHFVEAPLDELLEAGLALIHDEARRDEIVEAGQALLRDDVSMPASLRRVLDAP
jgi:hypothetical protein